MGTPGHADDASGFDPLHAMHTDCTLQRSPEISNAEGLIDRSRAVRAERGVTTELIRAIDHDIATGVWADMKGHGWKTDAWPGRGHGWPGDRLTHRHTRS